MKRRASRWVLTIGFAAITALIGAVWVAAVASSGASQAESRRLVDRSDRSSFLIANIGFRIARVRAETLETLTEDTAAIGPYLVAIDAQNTALDNEIAQLPLLLTPAEAASWQKLAPEVERMRRALQSALDDVHRGDPKRGEERLDDVVGEQEQLATSLAHFAELGFKETEAALGAADHAGIVFRRILSLAFAALIISTLVIAFVVRRALRRQDARIDEHIARIEESNRDLEAFAGRVAHDLKNILAPLHLAAPSLRRVKPDGVEVIAQRIERSTRRAFELLEGLLAFARAGGPPEIAPRASVRDELAGVLDDLEPLRERIDARVEVEVDDVEVAVAPPLLHVVLLNLVSNALKFLEGRDDRVVRVSAAPGGDGTCTILVSDSGPGIPADAINRICEPFFRVVGVKVGGAGIGLATVRRVIDAHGGALEFRSREGEGTNVFVTLRRARAQTAAAASSRAPTETATAAPPEQETRPHHA